MGWTQERVWREGSKEPETVGVRVGAELSQGPLRGRKTGAFRRMHLLGRLMKDTGQPDEDWGPGAAGEARARLFWTLGVLSLFPSLPAHQQSELLWQSVCVCPSVSMCPCVSLTLSTFPLFLIYVLSSFPVQVSFQAHIKIFCCVMVMQSRGHQEQTPGGGPRRNVCV